MRLILALGAAAAATTMIAYAQTDERPQAHNYVYIHHSDSDPIDADDDGWVSRAESSAAADRMFAEIDRNDDGRLDEADRPPMPEFDVRVEHAPHAREGDENCQRTETEVDGGRRVTIICDDERRESSDGERRRETRRHVEHTVVEDGQVIIRRGDGEIMVAPVPPIPPAPPLPPAPMFMMMFGEDSEADVNNDSAISQDEFRNMHLRLFDAHDVNGDGRVRAHRPPEPPTPPTPPSPPEPPNAAPPARHH